jgi:hypothetical protein
VQRRRCLRFPRNSVTSSGTHRCDRRRRVPEGQYCPDIVMSRRCEAVGRGRLILAARVNSSIDEADRSEDRRSDASGALH